LRNALRGIGHLEQTEACHVWYAAQLRNVYEGVFYVLSIKDADSSYLPWRAR
jgi:hypothetical protein